MNVVVQMGHALLSQYFEGGFSISQNQEKKDTIVSFVLETIDYSTATTCIFLTHIFGCSSFGIQSDIHI